MVKFLDLWVAFLKKKKNTLWSGQKLYSRINEIPGLRIKTIINTALVPKTWMPKIKPQLNFQTMRVVNAHNVSFLFLRVFCIFANLFRASFPDGELKMTYIFPVILYMIYMRSARQ